MKTSKSRKTFWLGGAAALLAVAITFLPGVTGRSLAQIPAGGTGTPSGSGPGSDDPNYVSPLGGRMAPPNFDTKKAGVYYADPGHPNLGGMWRAAPGWRVNVYYYGDGKPLPARTPDFTQPGWPFKPAWQKVYDARRAADKRNEPYGDPHADCWPNGAYRHLINGGAFEITETPGRVQFVFEGGPEIRRIYTDGRPHIPADKLTPTSHGDEIGHWEGNTLVVDTIGVRNEFVVTAALPHSSKFHVVERITREDGNTLDIKVRMEDPVAWTQAVTTELKYKLWVGDEMNEEICDENNRNRADENLVTRYDVRPHKHYGFDLPPEE